MCCIIAFVPITCNVYIHSVLYVHYCIFMNMYMYIYAQTYVRDRGEKEVCVCLCMFIYISMGVENEVRGRLQV